MAEAPAIDGSCAIKPDGVPDGAQCVMTDWGPNGYPAHWVYSDPEVPQTPEPTQDDDDSGCKTCKVSQSIKRKTSYGPLYTTTSTPLNGGASTWGFGVQSTPSFGSSLQQCVTVGDSPGVVSTASMSGFGTSVQSQQSFSTPFSDDAHSFQVCAPLPTSTSAPSFKPGVSLGVSGLK